MCCLFYDLSNPQTELDVSSDEFQIKQDNTVMTGARSLLHVALRTSRPSEDPRACKGRRHTTSIWSQRGEDQTVGASAKMEGNSRRRRDAGGDPEEGTIRPWEGVRNRKGSRSPKQEEGRSEEEKAVEDSRMVGGSSEKQGVREGQGSAIGRQQDVRNRYIWRERERRHAQLRSLQ